MYQTLFLPKSWKGAITLNPAPTPLAKGKTDEIDSFKGHTISKANYGVLNSPKN